MTIGRIFLLVYVALGLLTITGCSPLPRAEQPAQVEFVVLNDDSSVGQTFVARHRGLTAVDFYLKRTNQSAGQVKFTLRSSPDDSAAIASAIVPIETVNDLGYHRFSFPPQRDSFNRYYYASLEIEGEGHIRVGTASGEAYLNGALYNAGEPLDAQATFRLAYAPPQLALGLIRLGVSWVTVLAAGGFLFILPGWGIMSWMWPEWGEEIWIGKLALSAGVSLSLYPLLLLWTNLVGLNLGPVYAWLPPLVGALLILVKNWPILQRQKAAAQRVSFQTGNYPARYRSLFSCTNLAYVIVLLGIFGVRLWVIRDLDAPMWGDSVQHSVIAQLLIDNGGLFQSWLPYAELNTFTYHFGFHSFAAVYAWLTGASSSDSVLYTGQLVNIISVVSLVPLAIRLSHGKPLGGVLTVLFAGLLFPMPMYYVNWGRYTQLAGQAILPVAVLLIWKAVESERFQWPVFALAWISLSGLALTHYRVLFIALVFLLVLWIFSFRSIRIGQLFARSLILGAGSFLLFLPWFTNLFAGKLFAILQGHLAPASAAAANFLEEYNSIGSLLDYLPLWAWIVLLLAFGLQVVQKNRSGIIIAVWWLANLLLANPTLIGLPGTGALSNFAVFIALYIPASLLIGASILPIIEIGHEKLFRRSNRDPQRIATSTSLVILILLLVVSAWGTRARSQDVDVPAYALATRPDLRAASWIQSHTTPEALFYVNSFFAYGDTSVVGADGGWWLPLLGDRGTNLPPLNYSAESSYQPDYRERTNELVELVLTNGIDNPQVYAELRERGFTHVYLGQRQGMVNNPNPGLNPESLLSSQLYRPVYHKDLVWIFELVEQ